MSVAVFIEGQPIKLTHTVADEEGIVADPTTLDLLLRTVGGSTQTVGVVPTPDARTSNPTTGHYTFVDASLAAGHYEYEWQSATPDDVQYGEFIVRAKLT